MAISIASNSLDMTANQPDLLPFFIAPDLKGERPSWDFCPLQANQNFRRAWAEAPDYPGTTKSGVQVLEINQIASDDHVTQVRAGGTDQLNVKAITASLSAGWYIHAIPPTVLRKNGEYTLLDGATRKAALQSLGITSMPCLVYDYDVEKGIDLLDIIDTVGLSANNHKRCKAASKADFIQAASRWIQRSKASDSKFDPTLQDVIDWINNKLHTFSPHIVKSIATQALDVLNPDRLASFTNKTAVEWVKSHVNDPVRRAMEDKTANPVQVSSTSDQAYPARFLQKLITWDKPEPIKLALYSSSAKSILELEKERYGYLETIEKLHEAVLDYADRWHKGLVTKYEILGFIPQAENEPSNNFVRID